MNYDSFAKQLDGQDYARSNLYEVTIEGGILDVIWPYNEANDQPENLRFMVKAAQLPGKQLGEMQVKRFGAQYKVANDMIVDNMNMTIMCSEDMRERRYFDAWVSAIHGQSLDSGPGMNYRMGYYNSYISTVTIAKLDRKLKPIYTIELQEAWPNNMGSVDLSWENSEISTFTVGMTFRNWVEVETEKPIEYKKNAYNKGGMNSFMKGLKKGR